MSVKVDPYALDPEFERNVIALLAANREFYTRIGTYCEVGAFTPGVAQLVANAIRRLAKELGHGPGGRDVVLASMRRLLLDEKRFTFDMMKEATEYLLDGSRIDPSAYTVEMRKKIQRRFQLRILTEAMSAHVGGDLVEERTIERLKRLDQIGSTTGDVGEKFLPTDFEPIPKRRTGIYDLDIKLGGGLVTPGVAVFGASAKCGKSMALSQIGSFGFANGEFVAYLTTELKPVYQRLRMAASLANVEINMLERKDAFSTARVADAYKVATDNGGLMHVKQAEPDWTVDHVNRWLDTLEYQTQHKVTRLVIDYADHLTAKGFTDDYHIGFVVYSGLVWTSTQRELDVYTAAQRTRGKDENKLMTENDFAGSQHKIRLVDLGVTINRVVGTEMLQLMIVADRHCGQTGERLDPMPRGWSRGQLVMSGSAEDQIKQASMDTGGLFDDVCAGGQRRPT